MLQDMCNECWEGGFKRGRINTTLELSEVIKSELHKFVLNNDVIYVTDVINIIEKVKENVLHEEAYSSKGCATNT